MFELNLDQRLKKFAGKKEDIILLAYGGSHAYGTNNEQSDLDIRGICVNTPEQILSMDTDQTAYVDTELDTTLYYVQQAFQLLSSVNPNMIEILGCKPEHYLILSEEGKLILDNKDIFLSKKAIHSFAGYANQQLRRLQNALARDEYPQGEKEKHILNSIKSSTNHFKTVYKSFTDEEIKIYLDDSTKEHLEKEVFLDINLKHYPLRDFINVHSESMNIVKNYDKLNHRNSKKDIPHLLKHAMHLIRLFLMAIDILKYGEINTFRKEREYLLDIRSEKYTYEQIFKMADDLEREVMALAKTTRLPDEPNYKAINELKIRLNRMVLAR